jgi:mono/diheme cytochrome c family protein
MRSLGVLFVACVLLAPAQAFAADGAALYAKNCASCHGPDAKAATPAATAMKVPAIAGHDADGSVAFVKSSEKHKAPAGKLSDEELQAIGAFLAAQ